MVAQDGFTGTDRPEQEQEEESLDRRRRMSALSGIILLITLLVVLWLLWTYAQRPAIDDGSTTQPVAAATVVPDVVGLVEDEAVQTLSAAGFSVTVGSASDIAAAPGTVATQDPKGGASAQAGSVVLIAVVADNAFDETEGGDDVTRDGDASTSQLQPREIPGNATVPSLVGLSEAAAKKRIQAAGLDPRPMFQPKSDQIGKVYQQDPAPGTKVKEGRKVFILIGSMD